jgi:hypothetical protein
MGGQDRRHRHEAHLRSDFVDVPSSLEERLDTLGLDDLRSGVEHRLVVDLASRGHHHATTDGVERVRSETSTGGN